MATASILDRGLGMKKTAIIVAGLLAALMPTTSARAEQVVFVATGSQLPSSKDTGDSGTGTISLLGLWAESGASGDTIVEVTLPEYFTLTGTPAPDVWPVTYGFSRGSSWYDENGRTVLRGLGGTGQIAIPTTTDHACGLFGLAIDPTDGTLYAIIGRLTYVVTSDCRSTNRWLVKFNNSTGKWDWIGALNYFHGLEFLGDGTLMAIAGNGIGRGNVYTVDKSTAATTYRFNTSPGNDYSDLIYNPGDDRLYVADNCYLHRVNPADWSYTTENNGSMCNIRYAASTLLSDDRLLVRKNSGFYDIEVDPADGSISSLITSAFLGTGDWPRAPMIGSGTDRAAVSKSCTAVGSRTFSCSFGSIAYRAGVFASVPVSFAIPNDAIYGVRQGTVNWRRGGTIIASRSLDLTVLAPDVAVSITPTSNNYVVGNNDTFSIDIEALGGKAVNDVVLEVSLPSSVLTVTGFSGAGTCGLSRVGVTCSNIDVSAGGTQTVNINFRAEADGLAAVKATAIVAAGDVKPDNDSAESTVIVGNATDLKVAGPAATNGKVGTAINVEVKVSGHGPDDALNSVLTIPGDAGFKLGTATTDTGTCAASGTDIQCALGTMADGVTATISLAVTPSRPGKLKLPFKASSDVLDLTPGDNTYPFEVSVPTSPFVVSVGEATPVASRGDVRSVLQLAVTPADNGGAGIELTSLSGTLSIKLDGLSLKRKVLVFDDVDANGAYDETDVFVGSAVLSAEGDGFTVEFAKPVSAPAKKTTNLLLAVQAEGAPRVAGLPFGGSSNQWMGLALAALLPFAAAAFAFGRRRTAVAVMAGLTLGLVGACSEVDDLFDNAKVSATVTAVSGNLQDEGLSPVAASGLPLTGPTVTLTR